MVWAGCYQEAPRFVHGGVIIALQFSRLALRLRNVL